MGLYEDERDKISRTPQFIVEMKITSCDNNYANVTPPSTCTAVDAGVGSRCYYSPPTCQDIANFRINTLGLKTFKFCLKDAPLPVGGADIWPMLKSVVIAPQEIDPEKAVTVSERIKLVFYDDEARWNWNQDKASGGALTNTGTPSGTFWRRFMRIYRNYANPRNTVKVSVGFVAAGAVESDFKQRGLYLIDNLEINADGTVTMTLTDRLKLLKTKAPAKISETNLLAEALDGSETGVDVDDAGELTSPGTGYTVTILVDSEYMNVTSIAGNTLTVTRGRWGSSAATHADNSAWKEVVMCGTERSTPSTAPIGKNPIDILVELLNRAGIAAADIDTATLNSERDDWIPSTADATTGVMTGTNFQRAGSSLDSGNGGISIQTDIETLLRQVREAALLSVWVGEDQKVTGRIFAPARPSVTLIELTDNENFVKGSIEIDDNEKSRFNIIIVGYDLAVEGDTATASDYQKFISRADGDGLAPFYYGGTAKRIKVILSPWIRVSDTATAGKLAVHMLGRFRNPARKVSAELEVRDDTVKTGEFVYFSSARLQKADGTMDAQRIMEVQSKERDSMSHVLKMSFQDTGLLKRYGFIAPNGTPVYNSATVNQRRYGFVGTVAGNKVGALKEDGYYIW